MIANKRQEWFVHDLRRFARITNAFFKQCENHVPFASLYTLIYSFCKFHETLRIIPLMEVHLFNTFRDFQWIGDLSDAHASRSGPRGAHKKKDH